MLSSFTALSGCWGRYVKLPRCWLLICCCQGRSVQLPGVVCTIAVGSMLGPQGWYAQLPEAVCLFARGSMFGCQGQYAHAYRICTLFTLKKLYGGYCRYSYPTKTQIILKSYNYFCAMPCNLISALSYNNSVSFKGYSIEIC